MASYTEYAKSRRDMLEKGKRKKKTAAEYRAMAESLPGRASGVESNLRFAGYSDEEIAQGKKEGKKKKKRPAAAPMDY